MASASQTMHDAMRTSSWWTQIAPVVLGLGAFTVYATWRAFEGAYYWAPPYLSPFYSPLLDVHHRYWPSKCIECFLCQNVRHVLREHEKHTEFGGPRFFVRVAGLEMHPLDGVSRAAALKKELGIGLCNITKCCTEVCPEEITSPITPSFHSKSAWWTSFMIPCCGW